MKKSLKKWRKKITGVIMAAVVLGELVSGQTINAQEAVAEVLVREATETEIPVTVEDTDVSEVAEVVGNNSVLQMAVVYTDAEGNIHTVQTGCGFFIGNEEQGAEYVVTAREVTTVSEEKEQQMKEALAEQEVQEVEFIYEVRAVVDSDVMLAVEPVAESEEMGFSLWKLAQPMFDKQPLAIYDMDMTAMDGQAVTAVGFRVESEPDTDTAEANVITQKGQYRGTTKDGNVKFIYHDIKSNTGLIGGPILDENGYVVGLYQSKMVEEEQYALQMSEMMPVLDALGIAYEIGSAIEAQKEAQREAELAAMVHKEELQKVIEAAGKIKSNGYTQASYEAMRAVLDEAIELYESEEATQDEVDAAVEQLSVMITALKEKLPGWIFILMAVVVAVVIGSVVSIVWRRTAEDRELKKQQAYEDYTMEENTSTSMRNAKVSRDMEKESQSYDETTLLMPDMGETVLLYQEEPKKKNTASLTRMRTDEKIEITKDEFVLGKDPSQTDYYIVGNSAISRAHAVITSTDEIFEVEDKNATNGTFVNCMRVDAFQKTVLKDGDVLRLADEDFIFHIVENV